MRNQVKIDGCLDALQEQRKRAGEQAENYEIAIASLVQCQEAFAETEGLLHEVLRFIISDVDSHDLKFPDLWVEKLKELDEREVASLALLEEIFGTEWQTVPSGGNGNEEEIYPNQNRYEYSA